MSIALRSRVHARGGAAARPHSAQPSLPLLPVRRVAQQQRGVVTHAAGQDAPVEQDGLRLWARNIGLDTREGLFGFRPFAETWCGRLAMMGFITSIVEEFLTGRGTLAQMYLMEPGQPNYLVLALLVAVFGGATVYGSVDTVAKIRNKKLTPRDIARYKKFLALNNESAAQAEAAAMKAKSDFTTPNLDMAAINAARAQGSPVDAFLSTSELSEASQAAREMKAQEQLAATGGEGSVSPQGPAVVLEKKQDIEELMTFGGDMERAYALSVEQSNGRWAMLGFLAAVLVEAGTGKGILMQLIMWFKLFGFLGADSGF